MSDSAEFPDADNWLPEVRVATGARLHFGLLRTHPPYGGLGCMIESPATEVMIRSAPQFNCAGAASDRVQQVAVRLREFLSLSELPACEVLVPRRPHSHHGLGSGTQLAMAVAEGLSRFVRAGVTPIELACDVAGRGERSAVGVHGYFHGGLIYEDHRTGGGAVRLNPVLARHELPESWRVVLFRPQQIMATVSGDAERERFAQVGDGETAATQRLIEIAEEQLLPAVQSQQFDRFCDAVTLFNRTSGLLFEEAQGGPYNGSVISGLVATLQSLGARGVGQSSWGPSVFCWCASEEEAEQLVQRVPEDLAESTITRPRNSPREITTGTDSSR